MPRTLRSRSRQKKLQVQQIQQVNKTLIVNINNCVEVNIDNFNQMEFLSLFGLTRIVQNGQAKSNGLTERIRGHHTENNRKSLKRTKGDAMVSISDKNNEAFKIRCALGKPSYYFILLAFLPFQVYFVLGLIFW